MSDQKCPNCGKYTFKKEASPRGVGCLMILGGLFGPSLLAGGAQYHGGTADMGTAGMIGLVIAVIGLVMIIVSFFSKSKVVTYTCSDCKFSEKYNVEE